jgi:hypothetical protein
MLRMARVFCVLLTRLKTFTSEGLIENKMEVM